MKKYPYRLTVTWSSQRQWIIGVEKTRIGEDVARELGSNAGDFQHACLSHEKTGEVIWLRHNRHYNS